MHALVFMNSTFPRLFPFPALMSPEEGSTVDESRFTPRQAGDDASFIANVKAADSGLSIGWRWAQIIVTLVCFGFTIGIVYAKFDATERSITDLRTDLRDYRKEQTTLDKTTAINTRDLAQVKEENKELREQLRELRAVLNTMRDMREAYVYSSAGVKPKPSP